MVWWIRKWVSEVLKEGVPEVTINDKWNVPSNKIIGYEGELYDADESGLNDAISDAPSTLDYTGTLGGMVPITLPTCEILVDSKVVIDGKRIGFFGTHSRATYIRASQDLNDYIIEFIGNTACSGMANLTVYGDNFANTAGVHFGADRTAARFFNFRDRLCKQPSLFECDADFLHTEWQGGFTVDGVSGNSKSAFITHGKTRVSGPVTIKGVDRRLEITNFQIGEISDTSLTLEGVKTGRIDTTFVGAGGAANTYNAILLKDDAGGNPTENVKIASRFKGNTDYSFKNCVRMEGSTDYCTVMGNMARGAYGTSFISKSGTQNANGIEDHNIT